MMKEPKRQSWAQRCIAGCAATLLVLALSACGGSEESGGSEGSDPGPVHIHGLGVNPADESLFVAAHTGLFRLPEGESEPVRVGGTYQDTMGFTVVGPDQFLGSGHPDLQQDLPPYLGLIRSENAAESWEPVSLEGDADFHVLEAAGNRIYGFGSDFESREEQFLTSTDNGQSWDELEPPDSLISLAINPEDPDEVVASGARELFVSADGGRRWRPIPGEPGLLSWPEVGPLYIAMADGRIAAADSPRATWEARGEIGGQPAAFEASSGDVLVAALHDGAIQESTDGGAAWSERSAP